ncbi:hypothetical protein [Pseudohaliea sp.]|uniref:hypothetical protein n=1 Tax=Pseudohaliea sp. TaxID=2740289 RepID=UPI0032EEDC95
MSCSAAWSFPATETSDLRLYIAGSSAQDRLIEGLMRLRDDLEDIPALCAAGTLDIYQGSAGGARQRVFLCRTANAIAGVPAGKRLALFKASGGSGDGVAPLLDHQPVPFLQQEALSDGCEGSNRVLPTGNLSAYTKHVGCQTALDLVVPDAGISDLEPAMFASNTETLEAHPVTQLVWGLPVSRNFRNALQALQGLVPAEVPHDDPARETADAMPMLSSAQLRSIFAGAVDRWSVFYDRDGTPITVSGLLPEPPATRRDLSGTRPGAYRPDPAHGDRVYLCRRIDSSGTQLAYAMHYLRQGCTELAAAFVAPNDGSDETAGGDTGALVDREAPTGAVHAGRGSSNVRRCLDYHDDHNRWAIGMLSTENVGNYLDEEYRHIRIDGYAPTLLNAHRGLWRHLSTASIQWRADRDAREGDARPAILAYLAAYLGQPAVLSNLNRAFRHPWGQGGYLGAVDATDDEVDAPVTGRYLEEHPVSGVSYTHAGAPHSCLPPMLSGPSSVNLD